MIQDYGYLSAGIFFIARALSFTVSDIGCLNLCSYWVIIIPFAASFCFQFDGIFVGASQTTELRNAMIVSVAIYIVVSFFLIASFGNTGLWLSLCLFFIARALTLFVYMPRIYQRVE